MVQMPDLSRTTPEEYAATLVEYVQLGRLSLEISSALNAATTLSEMLTSCTEAFVCHLKVAFARIWILDEEEQMLILHASSGMYTHLDGQHARVPVGAFKIGLIASERKPHLTNAVIGDPRVSEQEWAKREGLIAFAGYPLLVGERLIGVVAMFARQPLHEATLLTTATIANGIALGVERLRMQEERSLLLASEQAARIEAERSHHHLHSLFMQAPALICVLRGPQHIYEVANPLYLQLLGQQEILGKSIREVLPARIEQMLIDLLDKVYTTGTPFVGREVSVTIDRHHNGVLEEGYFNFIYQPSRNVADEVDGILIHAVEVTELVLAREKSEQQQQRLALAQRSGRIGTFEWNIRQNHIFWTPELEALYGLPPGGFEGKYENWAQRVHPDDLQATEAHLQQVATNADIPYNAEFRVVWPDGTVRWLLAKGELTVFDEHSQPLKMVGVNIDITERKEAEQQKDSMFQRLQDLNANLEALVAQRTDVLQRSNQELQDFAYVASHDLQEPLRKIQAFGNLLEEEYAAALGAEGRSYLERMRNAAARMRVLIEDLLTFSRVTTKALPFSPVDLHAIALEAVDDLETRIQSTQGIVNVGQLPSIEADPRQIYQLFQNLIANALKFHQPGCPPVVNVSASLVQDSEVQTCLICVEDNGIGFNEKYLDRIFTVFQRLHGRSDYEGTGVGLAVVKKIAERHGGTVTARSTPGQGSTFLVTLPVQNRFEGGSYDPER